MRYIEGYGPISVQQLGKGQKRGSNIGVGETLLGIRPATMWQQDPKGAEQFFERKRQFELRQRRKSDIRQQNLYRPNAPSGPTE
jgi:hypothetical protein